MKIFIADDHPIFRQGLLQIIEGDPELEIVGESGDGEEALQLIRSLCPDIAVLDISMPGMSGLEIVSEVQKESLKVEFIILTMFDDEEYFNEAMELGVKGYLLKENATSDLINCLRAVEKGKHYVSPMISDYLIKRRERTKAITEKVPSIQDLTQMEQRVLRLLAENKTSKEIATELFISYRTVQNHRNNIANKLNLKGANKLLQFAIENKAYLSGAVKSGFEPETIAHSVAVDKAKLNFKSHAILISLASILVFFIATAFYFLRNSDKSDSGFQNESSVFDTTHLDKNRIAVLPFTNISRESTDEYLSDGMTDELITTLSKIKGLRVIASTSTMKYKGTSKGISEISRELEVGTILEGSVRKVGDQLRVSAQLIDASTEEHIWAQDYDRQLKDIFAIQRDIAQRVAQGLKLQLLSPKPPNEAKNINPETYTCYLKGRYFWNQRTQTGFKKALEYFTAAIELDAEYALAHAGLADTYILLSNYYYLPPNEAFPKAKQAVIKALEIDSQLAEAHNSLATINYLYDWDFLSAEREFRKAIDLNPNYATAYQIYAICLANMGRFDEAISVVNRAFELDPVSRIINAVVGRIHHRARQYDKAIKNFQKTIEIDPQFFLVYIFLGETYICKEMYTRALESFQKAVEILPSSPFPVAVLAFGYAAAGKKIQALQILDKILAVPRNQMRLSYQIATIYAALEDKDKAFEWLEVAYQQKHDFMLDIKVDQKLDNLRSDPRFSQLLKKVGLDS